jgi:hypothetical protein
MTNGDAVLASNLPGWMSAQRQPIVFGQTKKRKYFTVRAQRNCDLRQVNATATERGIGFLLPETAPRRGFWADRVRSREDLKARFVRDARPGRETLALHPAWRTSANHTPGCRDESDVTARISNVELIRLDLGPWSRPQTHGRR